MSDPSATGAVPSPSDVRLKWVRPALSALEPIIAYSPIVEDLLIGTGAQESAYRYARQIGGGPALGCWQMEPATHDDCWSNFIVYRPGLSIALHKLVPSGNPTANEMVTNPLYACAMARVKYLRSSMPMPAASGVDLAWPVYKSIYNTAGGAATEDEFRRAWAEWVAPTDA